MNWIIETVDFKLKKFETISDNIIGAYLVVKKKDAKIKYKITNYLGKGSIGQVYLIEKNDSDEKFVIKISKPDCKNDLANEIISMENIFKANKINHRSYPLFYGEFQNLNSTGAIFPFLGYYSLDKLKAIDYRIGMIYNKDIIKQLLNQLKNFKNIIHADLKPANIVLDVKKDKIIATIIDFGLIKPLNNPDNIISTSYVTSPESILSLDYFADCLVPDEIIDFSKHDYIGLFCISIHLFTKKGFWTIISKYLTFNVGVPDDSISKQKAVIYFVYTWFKFFYPDIESIEIKSLQNMIRKILTLNPQLDKIKDLFFNFDNFFNQCIIPNLDLRTIDQENIELLKNFSKKIIHFNYEKRPDIDTLLSDPFLA